MQQDQQVAGLLRGQVYTVKMQQAMLASAEQRAKRLTTKHNIAFLPLSTAATSVQDWNLLGMAAACSHNWIAHLA
jgi:hypothetical protein